MFIFWDSIIYLRTVHTLPPYIKPSLYQYYYYTVLIQTKPILDASYSTVMYTGGIGTAMIPKVVSNMLCCVQVVAMGEVLMLG